MKMQMNMCKCNIDKMMFMDNLVEEPAEDSPCVVAVSETLSCNILQDGEKATIIIQEKFILEATKWDVMDLGNDMIMIKEFSGNRYWTANQKSPGDPLELIPASDDPMQSQIFKKTAVGDGFALEADGLLILFSSVPPKEGVGLITGDQSVARAVFFTVNADFPDRPC